MSSTNMPLVFPCSHYQAGNCRSCQYLSTPYEQQLAQKNLALKQQLADLSHMETEWLTPYPSALQGFRNKAKMAVSGVVERPILSQPQNLTDLTDCPLYPAHFQTIFTVLKDFIPRAGLVPYNLQKRKGELKYILLTESQWDNSLMLRFVLRSEIKLPLIQRELGGLLNKLPRLKVVSVNIQPQHAAILEGEKEIFLTEKQMLEENFNHIPLFIRPQGFFQTNPSVASALYRTAQQWVEDLPIKRLWDLFCGVGGFGLHCAYALQQKGLAPELIGIEISASAIAAAQDSAQKLGLKQVKFQALDVANFSFDESLIPDLVIMNPPRRGVGKEVIQFLSQLNPKFILYSSCNPKTMAQDLAQLKGYKLQKVKLFDMFPHTSHQEALTLLSRI